MTWKLSQGRRDMLLHVSRHAIACIATLTKPTSCVFGRYNSISYDLPYIFQRAEILNSRRTFRNLSRFNALPTERLLKPWRYHECLPSERKGGVGNLNKIMYAFRALPATLSAHFQPRF